MLRHTLLLAFLFLLSLTARALPANVEHVETFGGISHYRLKSNGMPILLTADRSAPVEKQAAELDRLRERLLSEWSF